MSTTKPLLTIAIPTYNRHAQLIDTIKTLLPQLNANCSLIILDNCSDLPVEQSTSALFSQFPHVNYKIYRNKINVGGDSNIIRCFEYCETQWLWTLGDDDILEPDAVKTILSDLIKYAEAVSINYYSPHDFHPVRSKTVTSFGVSEFLANIDSFGASIFISTNVYNLHKINSYWQANHNTYSCASQWLVIYYALTTNTLSVLSHQIICTNNIVPDGTYSSINLAIARGFSTLIDLLLPANDLKALIKALCTVTHQWITIEGVAKSLLVEYMSTGKNLNISFYLARFYNGFYKYCGFKTRLKYYAFALLFAISPELSFNLVRKLYLRTRGVDIRKFIR